MAVEEPRVTSLAIRPGVVATKMQEDLAANHFASMDPKDVERFKTMRAEGQMLEPAQPGNVMARLVLDPPSASNGKFLK